MAAMNRQVCSPVEAPQHDAGLVNLLCAGFLLKARCSLTLKCNSNTHILFPDKRDVIGRHKSCQLYRMCICIDFTKIIYNEEMAFLLPLSPQKCGFGGLSVVGNKTDAQINIATIQIICLTLTVMGETAV